MAGSIVAWALSSARIHPGSPLPAVSFLLLHNADIFLFQVCRHSRHLICLQLLGEYAPNHTENLQCGQMPRVADKFHPRCPCPLLGESPINGTHHARAVIGRWRPVKILATCPFDALIEIRLQVSRLERPQTRLQNHRKPKQVGKEKVCKTPHSCTKGPDQSTEHPPHCKASFYNVSSVKTVSKTLETDTVSVRKPKTTKTQRKPDSKKLRKKS